MSCGSADSQLKSEFVTLTFWQQNLGVFSFLLQEKGCVVVAGLIIIQLLLVGRRLLINVSDIQLPKLSSTSEQALPRFGLLTHFNCEARALHNHPLVIRVVCHWGLIIRFGRIRFESMRYV
jgi:hypothetical protein